ncbi:MAG: hypothetical protein SO435_01970 [Peptostreptococcus porci]|nr:hypothetical protein [Peptostreptococcus porci]
MNLSIDREVMRWFDSLFQSQNDMISINNFICKLDDYDKSMLGGKVISLGKYSTNYWKLEFNISDSYLLRLKKNIHPLFNEYIYEEMTLYNDDNMFTTINRFVIRVFNIVADYEYDVIEGAYYINYNRYFVELCRGISHGDVIKLDYDVLMLVNSDDNIVFFNDENTIKLNLRFDIEMGEDILDSLLDLRKSIITSKIY